MTELIRCPTHGVDTVYLARRPKDGQIVQMHACSRCDWEATPDKLNEVPGLSSPGWMKRRAERALARGKLVLEVSATLDKSTRENVTHTPVWILAEVMVAALESYETAVMMNHSSAAWAPPGHQGPQGEPSGHPDDE